MKAFRYNSENRSDRKYNNCGKEKNPNAVKFYASNMDYANNYKFIYNEDGDVIAITPTLKSLYELNEEDIVLVDLEGNLLTKGKPSSEVDLHLEIYKKRSDVNGIVHTHSPYATGFAFSSKRIKRRNK